MKNTALALLALSLLSSFVLFAILVESTNRFRAQITALDAELASRMEEIAHLEEQLDKTEQDLSETRRDLIACRLWRIRPAAGAGIDRVAESRW